MSNGLSVSLSRSHKSKEKGRSVTQVSWFLSTRYTPTYCIRVIYSDHRQRLSATSERLSTCYLKGIQVHARQRKAF